MGTTLEIAAIGITAAVRSEPAPWRSPAIQSRPTAESTEGDRLAVAEQDLQRFGVADE